MNLHNIYTLFFTVLAATLLFLFTGYSNGPGAQVDMGFTGAPGETGQVCGGCHNLAGSYGIVQIELTSFTGTLPYEYIVFDPTYMEVEFSTAMGTPAGYGFQLIMMDGMGNPMDVTYFDLSDNAKQITLSNGRTYIEHNGISSDNLLSFIYILNEKPADGVVNVHVGATAVNGNGMTTGDSGSTGFTFSLLEVSLPVELTDLKATRQRSNIQLDWTTETERDNEYFALEHSTNGIDFSTIKTLEGAGTSSEKQQYTYTHTTPANGDNYYRLRMIDIEGKEAYSKVVVEKFISVLNETSVFPQPAAEQAKIYIQSSAQESVDMQVYDLTGRMIYNNQVQLHEGENYIDVNCSEWVSGHYAISISGELLGEEVVKFVKQ